MQDNIDEFEINAKKQELDNGLRVVIKDINSKIILSKLRVNWGIINEKEEERGFSHILEHWIMGNNTNGDIKYRVIDLNAITKLDRTEFNAEIVKDDVEAYFQWLSKIFCPSFNEDILKLEKKRIMEEEEVVKREAKYFFKIKDIIYRGHPKGIVPFKNKRDINQITAEELKKFYKRGYYPANMDLILVGSIPRGIEKKIKEHFGGYKSSLERAPPYIFPELEELPEKILIYEEISGAKKEDKTAGISLHFIITKQDKLTDYSAALLSFLLGNPSNSILFNELSLNRGLTYSVCGNYNSDYNAREFKIMTEVCAKRVDEALDIIFKEIDNLKKREIDNGVLSLVKRNLRNRIFRKTNSLEGYMYLIEAEMDSENTIKEHLERLEEVDTRKLLEAANKYLPDRDKGKYLLLIEEELKKKNG